MFEVLNQVSNQRVQKDEGIELLVTPGEGLMRLTGKAAEALGVTDINRIVTLKVKHPVTGQPTPAIYVSPWAHEKDENGELKKDEEGSELIVLTNEEAPENLRGHGRKLGYPNGQNGRLQFSCTPSWMMLEGTTEGTKVYTIGGFTEADANLKGTKGGVTVYILTEDKEKYADKKVVTKKEKGSDNTEE